MRAKEFIISEARGLFLRSASDRFLHRMSGVEANFVNIVSYPQMGQYTSVEERNAAVDEVTKNLDTVEWVNGPPTADLLAFAIAELQTSDGEVIHWGKYFKEILINMGGSWPNTQTPDGEWRLNTASGAKMFSGFDPQTLIGTEVPFNSVAAVISQVESKLGSAHTLVVGLRSLAQGQLPVFKGMGDQLSAIRDYFGEIMGPIALAHGLVGGNGEDARAVLLKDKQGAVHAWNECRIMWPQAANYNLIDSNLLTPWGTVVGISSKGGSGARASIKNIYDLLITVDPKFKVTHAKEVSILETIAKKSQIQGPLQLAVDLGIIRNDSPVLTEIPALISNPNLPISPAIKQLTDSKISKFGTGYNPGFHALAAIAYRVADHINDKTNMGQVIKMLLNNSSMLQIHLNMSKKGNDAVVKSFSAKFPAVFAGTFKVNASKGYASTGINQKFTFGFDV